MIVLEDIGRIRKRIGLTQHALAKLAGVSQSLIAKIESGRIDPSHSLAMRIISFLESQRKKSSLTADQLMHKGMVSVASTANVAEAIKLMTLHAISQVPVMDGSTLVGLITENDILQKNPGKKSLVNDVMGLAPPSIPAKAPSETVIALLKHTPVVIVTEKGKSIGIISKADALQVLLQF